MKSLLAATVLAASQASAQVTISPDAINSVFCTEHTFISSCVYSDLRENNFENTLAINTQLLGTQLQTRARETERGLETHYKLGNKYGVLETKMLEGHVQATSLSVNRNDWNARVQYLHDKEEFEATLQKENFRVQYKNENISADYRFGNFRFQNSFGQEYSTKVIFEFRF